MAKASQGASITFVFALAVASYVSLHPVLLFPPLLLLCYDARASRSTLVPKLAPYAVTLTAGFGGACGLLLYLSELLTGSWEFLSSTYGVRLLLPDLTPNVGLWWYFFIEMFDSFREFFLGVFWLHVASYMPGFTIRLRKQPLFVATTLTGIFAIFTPYPSIADAALYLSLLPLFRHLFPCKWTEKSLYEALLIQCSDAVFIPRVCCSSICLFPRTRILLSVDLCGVRKCQFLLRNHIGLELGPIHYCRRFALRCVKGRVGRGEA